MYVMQNFFVISKIHSFTRKWFRNFNFTIINPRFLFVFWVITWQKGNRQCAGNRNPGNHSVIQPGFHKLPFSSVLFICMHKKNWRGSFRKFSQNAWFSLPHGVILDPSLEGQWRIQDFPGGAPTSDVGTNLLFGIMLAESCMKIGLRQGRVPCVPVPQIR